MEIEKKYWDCVGELSRYVSDAGFSDVVVGISGGIDSALVATMCVDAFGADHVHGVMLPGPFSSDHSLSDAEDLATRLEIGIQTISIMEPYKAFKELLEESCEETFEGLPDQNMQARCRMICLMGLSNANNWMLINTGNKTEVMLGYSTLYGDSAGAFAPVGGLYKTDVFAAARWRNGEAQSKGKTPPIPENSITKAPSAELAPGQEDEKCFGLSYEEIDNILIPFVEQGVSEEELCAQGISAKDVSTVISLFKRNAFKRQSLPPYPQFAFYQ